MSLRARLLIVAATLCVATAAPVLADPAIGKRVDAVMADDTVTITEAGKTVLVYRTKAADPAEPGRLNYVHPLYAPDGTVLTEDRPADHIHHRGLFWAWHQITVNGKLVADQWFMKDIAPSVREKRFKGDARGGGTLTIDADWLVKTGGELSYVAGETTKITVHPLKAGGRRIDFETTITSKVDALGLGGSDDVKGYGGFSARFVAPDRLTFASAGKTVTATNTAVAAGPSMGFAWPAGSGGPAWSLGLACKANGQPITQWILRKELSMQNCVFPGRAPFILKKGETLKLQETLIIRPATPPKARK